MRPRTVAGVLVLTLAATCPAGALDRSLPSYQTASGVAGQLKSVGSDTLNNEMELWAKGFKERYPDVKIEIEGKGSATAPPALLDGTSQFAPMSRPMTSEEVDAFEKKYGHKPSVFRVAIDALAIYVNKDNPIQCLSMPQLNQVFSATRKITAGSNIRTWGELGLTGEWSTRPITFYGRNSLSGTYEFFREIVLYNGEYKQEVVQQPGSEAVVDKVAGDRSAIGYSGIGYKTAGVRTVPLSTYVGLPCYDTSAEATLSGKYPIARYLYIYVNKDPDKLLDPLRAEFIKYILSKDGQAQTERGGYYPITNEMRDVDLKRLGIAPVSN